MSYDTERVIDEDERSRPVHHLDAFWDFMIEQGCAKVLDETPRNPVCGVTFCVRCGDCIACYGGDPCMDGDGLHVWPDDPESYVDD
jgi:hypothetical protein